MSGFQFKFTKEQIRVILKNNSKWEEWADALLEILPKYDIVTVNRVTGFISQCAHESLDFRVLEENLNYSEKGLNRTFSKYFRRAGVPASEYARQPEKIANYVYGNRLGNGDVSSGDGWRFRGGGLIQLTGRYNYTKFGESIGMSAEDAADYVRTRNGAIESACFFWKTNNLNSYCDRGDVRRLSKRINGGDNGMEDRINRWNTIKNILSPEQPPTFQRGSVGTHVRNIQRALRITVDGDFGPNTERAVKSWQLANGYTPSGVLTYVAYRQLVRRV